MMPRWRDGHRRLREFGNGGTPPWHSGEEMVETVEEECIIGEFSQWSPCSVDCGPSDGTQFRWRIVVDNRPALAAEATVTDEGEAIVGSEVMDRESCPSPVEVRTCSPNGEEEGDNILLPSSVDSSSALGARRQRSSSLFLCPFP